MPKKGDADGLVSAKNIYTYILQLLDLQQQILGHNDCRLR